MQKLLIGLAVLGLIVIGPLTGSARHLSWISAVPKSSAPGLHGFKSTVSAPSIPWKFTWILNRSGAPLKFQVFRIQSSRIYRNTGTYRYIRLDRPMGQRQSQLRPGHRYCLETLQFKLHFSGESVTPLAFDFWAWDGGVTGTLKESSHLDWSGSKWTITYNNNDPHCISLVVPLPGGASCS